MAKVEADLLSQTYTSIWENVTSVTGTIIIVCTNIHHCSKVFTTGQARGNPEDLFLGCDMPIQLVLSSEYYDYDRSEDHFIMY